jgi:hypothetical protein
MGNGPKVTLMLQCKVDGKWKKLPAPISPNGRPKPVPGGTHYLRYQRNCWKPVGKDPDAALAAKRRCEIALEGVPGVSIAGASVGTSIQSSERLKLEDATEQYLTDTETQKEPKTHSACKIAVNQFCESCPKVYLDELERRDLLNFVAFLRKYRKKNGELLSERTIHNRFENVITFLKDFGVRGLVQLKDWPEYEEEDAVPYTAQELRLLFAQVRPLNGDRG